ncbi:hypothetical protein D3C81_1118360 [compost metagenome]
MDRAKGIPLIKEITMVVHVTRKVSHRKTVTSQIMVLLLDLITEALTATVAKVVNKAKVREKVTTAAVASTITTETIVLTITVRVDLRTTVVEKVVVVEVHRLLNSIARKSTTLLRKLSFVVR